MTDKRDLIAVSRLRTTAYERFDDAFYQFVCEFWEVVIKDKMVDNWHIKYLCGELQQWSKSIIKRQPKEYDIAINIPPGESKSTICSVMFPAWLWAIDPTLQLITVSYNGDLSTELSVKSKDVISSDKYQILYGSKYKIRADQDAKFFYKNTAGGWRLATSVGAKVTGYHAHVKIMDDGNNPNDSSNPELFDKDSLWYDQVFRNRNVEESTTLELFVQQRVSINDMTAHILSKEKKVVKLIKIPATTEYDIQPPELIRYYKDGLMNPARRGWDVMEKLVSDMGDFYYSAQYGQEPSKLGGGLVASENFEIIEASEMPSDFFGNPVYYFVDSAFKDKQKNDPSGILVVIPYRYSIYVLDFIDERLTYLKLKDRLQEIYFDYSGSASNSLMVVEEASSGYAIIEELKYDTPVNVMAYPKSNDGKYARFSACTNSIKGGKVKLIKDSFAGRSWNKKYIEILTKFPNVPHDEAVDVTVMAIEELIKKERDFEVYEREIITF